MRKYYLKKHRRIGFQYDTYEKAVELNSPTEFISINQKVDTPDIELSIQLTDEKVFNRPKNSEYTKYTQIEEEDYLNYLTIALEVLSNLRWGEEEVYFIEKDHSMYEAILFSNTKSNRYNLFIEINYALDSFYLMIYYSDRFYQRKYYRENGTIISSEQFKFLLIKTVEYLEDDKNYKQNAKDLFKTFNLIYKGKIKPELPRGETNLSPLLISLQNQIKQLEFRLINNDRDKKSTREKIRGQIIGFKSAINEINQFIKNFEKSKD